jgi:hypothetical protein
VALPVKTPGEGSRIYTTTWDANRARSTSILAIRFLSNGLGERVANRTSSPKGPYSLDMVGYRPGLHGSTMVGVNLRSIPSLGLLPVQVCTGEAQPVPREFRIHKVPFEDPEHQLHPLDGSFGTT